MALGGKRTADIAAYTWLLWLGWRLIQFFFYPYKEALVRYKRRSPQPYALVTGASGGIGLGFAEELISHGFGVIITARKKDKLLAVAEKLRSDFSGASVETIVFDAINDNNDELVAALKPIMELPITIVINNVGGVTLKPIYRTTSEYSAADVDSLINSNLRFMTQVSRIMLPTLVRNGPSAILHISSAAFVGVPYLSIYGASKAYVNTFAGALAREAKAEGWKVDSLAVVPAEVVSEGNSTGVPSWAPTSRQYAKLALDRVEMAVDRGMRVMTPFWMHALQVKLLESVPEKAIQYMLGNTIKTKKEALEKGE